MKDKPLKIKVAKGLPQPEGFELPKAVAVGGLLYGVHAWNHDEALAGDLLGYCDNLKGHIKIADGLNDQRTAEVLLHEVLHAIFHQSGIEATREGEEKVVSGMTYGLIGLIRHNPDFMPYLKRLLDRGH